MPEIPDETHLRLLRAIAAQDRAALADFYDLAGGVLFATALKMLGDTHEAEEVVQDVFVQIWTKAATFDASLGAPFHWALGITRNRCIDRIRARQRRSRLFDDVGEETKSAVAVDNSAAIGLNGEELGNVRTAVRSLPADQRQAIELAFFGGLTHQEIAEQLREPLGTVKARIRRGMLKLRDSLQPYL
jgi:RNA polymerase sigma-70 factor (ECF subfamily)